MRHLHLPFLLLLSLFLRVAGVSASSPLEEIQTGRRLLNSGELEAAADSFWSAIMRHNNSLDMTDLKDALELFLLSYKKRDIAEEGFLKIGRQFIVQGLVNEGVNYLTTALSINPKLLDAHLALMKVPTLEPPIRLQHVVKALELDPMGYKTHFEVGSELFGLRSWDSALAIFEKAFLLNSTCWQSLSSVIYLRLHVCKWGNFGSQYQHDMTAIERIIHEEIKEKEYQKKVILKSPVGHLTVSNANYDDYPPDTEWVEFDQASLTPSAIHMHMLLGYDISSELKLKVAQMHTAHEQSLVRRSGLPIYNHLPEFYSAEADAPNFRIKVGYVSANIRSKTTVYMAQDLFRFHDRSKFEVHVYATTPNDSPSFLESAMGGVDWRAKVRDGVEFFHDVAGMNVKQVSQMIRSHGIHILVDWDGHSNNMVRLSGIFPMQTAPIQVGHQEFIGTTGATYIQYIITDKVASPPEFEYLYTEKFIYMPNTFLANSMAYLSPHISPPNLRLDYDKKYVEGNRGSNDASLKEKEAIGTGPNEKKKTKKRQSVKKEKHPKQPSQIKKFLQGDPASNGCGGLPASFVYCNFNKHLKFSPDVMRSWLTILQNVDDSVLCLLHNPQDSEKYLMSFVNDFDESLASRVRFLPFVSSPFENQKRISHVCNAALDTPVYNGHTCSVDALWAGVPVVVYGNTVEMASRVGMSMMTTLGLPEMIAEDQDSYNEIAIRMAEDTSWYRSIRRRLISTCYSSPMNPLWDLRQYVEDLELGFTMVWQNFLSGNEPHHADIAAFRRNFGTNTSHGRTPSQEIARDPVAKDLNEVRSTIHGVTQGLWNIVDEIDRCITDSLKK